MIQSVPTDRIRAEVAKLADALDLGSSVERRASSSLALGTNLLSAAFKEGYLIL